MGIKSNEREFMSQVISRHNEFFDIAKALAEPVTTPGKDLSSVS